MKKYMIFAAPLTVLMMAHSILTGCGTMGLGRVLFTSETLSDAEWSGVKAGPVVGLTPSIANVISPQANQLSAVLTLLGQVDPLGVLMPVNHPGDPVTRWVLCVGDDRKRCESAPVNSQVSFAGKMEGVFWRPSRLVIKDK